MKAKKEKASGKPTHDLMRRNHLNYLNDPNELNYQDDPNHLNEQNDHNHTTHLN